jgi:uncharacterized glyoxalase superfamily protein PhnB
MERAIPILPFDDPETAKQFYVDGLGFHVVFEVHYPYEPTQGTILGVERGTIRLHLDSPMPGHGRDACAYLEVTDADSLYDEWRSKVQIQSPPESQPWGARTFTVIDPSGNALYVAGPAPEPTEPRSLP